MKNLTVVNRSSKTLTGVWDGKRYDMLPHQTYSFPEIQAQKFKEQHPVMGTENPYTLQKEYLIGLPDLQEDCSPIEQSTAIELWNRTLMPDTKSYQVIKGNGLFSPNLDRAPSLPFDGPGFVKP